MTDMSAEPQPVAPLAFADLTQEFVRLQKKSVIKIGLLAAVIIVMMTLLLLLFGQRDFIQSITKYKPYKGQGIAAAMVAKDAVDWKKLELLKGALGAYVKQATGAARQLETVLASIQSAETLENNRYIEIIPERTYTFQLETINGYMPMSLFNINPYFIDEHGNNVSSSAAKKARIGININKILIGQNHDITVNGSSIAAKAVDRDKVHELSVSGILQAMDKADAAAVIGRLLNMLNENTAEASTFIRESEAIVLEKEAAIDTTVTKISTTDEIFIITVFNRVLGAVAMFGIVGVCLRLIAAEFRFLNGTIASYISFMYAEVGASPPDRLNSISHIVQALQGGQGKSVNLSSLPIDSLGKAIASVVREVKAK
jgi:hypothetical protein